MNCNYYSQYETGKINDSQFQDHLQQCPFCREEISRDGKLMDHITTLNHQIDIPDNWDSIETLLRKEKENSEPAPLQLYKNRIGFLFRAAAILIVLIGLSVFYTRHQAESGKEVLGSASLKRIEQIETDYLEAIEELEAMSNDKLAEMDIDLMLLYKDKISTIDDQINHCREAISRNPGNHHIRKYLLAALQEKKETFREILELKPENS